MGCRTIRRVACAVVVAALAACPQKITLVCEASTDCPGNGPCEEGICRPPFPEGDGDAGSRADAGDGDAGSEDNDAGPSDAGTRSDAGADVGDAGADAGAGDAGPTMDAGTSGDAGAPSIGSVAAGGIHGCAFSAGALKCWGTNTNGQIGDSSNTLRPAAVGVTGLASGGASVAAGDWHTCSVDGSGGARCWGYGLYGQLGTNGTLDQNAPAAVWALGSGVAVISAGSVHTCAVASGAAKCWGNNLYGQLGDGNAPNDAVVPSGVSGLGSGLSSISAGGHHTCALLSTGNIKCWGENTDGQLGIGTTGSQKNTPADVTSLSGVLAVLAGGRHTCALLSGGSVKCWGLNDFGQVGDNSGAPNRPSPVSVAGLQGSASAIAVGGSHGCALLATGTLQCWGNNPFGQIGDGTSNNTRPSATAVPNLTGVAAVACGSSHTCAALSAGGVRCWGKGGGGQLGNGGTADSANPVDVQGL